MLEQLLNMEYGYFWIMAGLVLVILESLGAMFALFSLGVGAWITAIVAFFGWLSLSWLLGLFAVASLAVFGATRPLANRLTGAGRKVKTNAEALVGSRAVVSAAIGGRTQPGYVKVAGDEWRALAEADVAIAAGSEVEIRRLEGATLFVRPLPDSPGEEGQE